MPIRDEFLTIASRALRSHKGADSVTATAVRPSPVGPLVEWRAPLVSSQRERRPLPGGGSVIGAPAGTQLLTVLARAMACRWRNGPPLAPATWAEDLAAKHPLIFGFPPSSHAGWSWLWQAGAELITEHGIPRGFQTTDTKEKFGTLRWDIQANECADYADSVVDCLDHLSGFICEYCGAPGFLRKGSWVKSECDAHAQGKPAFRSEEA
jgi:hypothetical protein